MGLLQLGIVPAVTQFVAVHAGRGEAGEMNRAASTAMSLLTAVAVLVLFAVPAAGVLVSFFEIPSGLSPLATRALQIGFISFALQMPGFAFNAFLSGAQRQDRCNQVWILSLVLRFLAAVATLEAGLGLLGLLSAELVLVIAMDVLLGTLAYANVPGLHLSPSLVRPSTARALTSFGGLLLISSVLEAVISQTDRLVIAAFLPVAMVTYYSAAWKLYAFALAVPATLVHALMPAAAALSGRGEHAALEQLFLRMTKYAAAIAWPLGFSLLACTAWLLKIWLGDAFVEHAPTAQILICVFLIVAHNQAGYAVLHATRRMRSVVWGYQAPQALLNLILSLTFVNRFGILGVALGTLVPVLILQPLFVRFVLRELDFTWHRFVRSSIAPAFVPAVLSFAPTAVVYVFAGALSPVVPIAAAASAIVYALAFWRLSLTAVERNRLIELFFAGWSSTTRPVQLAGRD
jgi:O-antigen/teichoic acid export membrane protein